MYLSNDNRKHGTRLSDKNCRAIYKGFLNRDVTAEDPHVARTEKAQEVPLADDGEHMSLRAEVAKTTESQPESPQPSEISVPSSPKVASPAEQEVSQLAEVPDASDVEHNFQCPEEVLEGIWKTPTEYVEAKLQTYFLLGFDFQSLWGTQLINDQVINAYLVHLAGKSKLKANVIDTFMLTKILTGNSRIALPKLAIYSQDVIVDAVHEPGHWSLMVVFPKLERLVYVNPLGEPEDLCKAYLTNWSKYMKMRRSINLDGGIAADYMIGTVRHPKLKDSTSCGLYVMKFARHFLEGHSNATSSHAR